MLTRKISILGSTGSIGTQTLDVIRQTGCAEVVGLSVSSNIKLLEQQILEFKPRIVSVMDGGCAAILREIVNKKGLKTEILSGQEGNLAVATMPDAEAVCNALVGSAGLLPTEAAINVGKDILLANKETLVVAGEVIMPLAKQKGVSILPIDSEHSAIFQCINGENVKNIEKVYLTASGGPFRGKSRRELQNVTLSDALNHPNWQMGSKITIDSATLMNKGFEYIEAKWLFNFSDSQIEVLVHPQSVIHSMVEFCDGAIMAQLGAPDMRTPIQYALTYPNRIKNNYKRLNFLECGMMTFEKPDEETFPCLKYAKQAVKQGGVFPAILNAANEIAVARFLSENISFNEIPLLIEQALSAYTVSMSEKHSRMEISDILVADKWARDYTSSIAFA